MKQLTQESLQYLKLPVSVKDSGLLVNPTTYAVKIAIDSQTEGFVDAEWETDSTGDVDIYLARVLVGPGSADSIGRLDKGTHNAYVKITATPEIPVLGPEPFEII